ncbi:hypothetical protein BJF79_15475 [Actinomadura sp. CNU-125]|uniref:hypothetical protein n=1 Tax=Actinomadura sp. CNU-125 TaxID=1904961 RepID=UPI00095BD476|nr:hypothetical protein [Actinomadura sp. CNU-125]OLT21665.1 hypothetical protein BJF79_15475 [Actinomadura sp. CNU-125]
MTATSLDAEHLGTNVWDALVSAGFEPGPDGFDVLKPLRESFDHVVVVARFEHGMYGLGTPGVRRGRYYRLAGALTEAGYKNATLKIDGVPHALIVPGGSRTADEIAADLGGDGRG